MQYKTIVLELLQQNSEMYNQLRKNRTLLPTLEHYSTQLKASHEAWKTRLSETRPESHPSQIASEALELALKELVSGLPTGSSQTDDDTLSLDAAMAHIRGHTPTE